MSQSLTKTETPNQVDCLLIPLKDKNLLLPNVTVAEIIPFSHLLTTASSVDWMLGRLDWRGTPVPVVCYEMLNQQAAPAPNPNARFAVVNGVGNHAAMPFFAILVQGIPRLVHINEKDIQEVEAMNMGAFDMQAVSIDEGQAMIPDLDRLEQSVLSAL
ncbi:MAG: chemotaxis protein CheW [Oceanospirillaceae bacterium]|uniref:chemotaxis protein CheW n=1 Tax=unclassified Thalassolituus TaxID=2624967 RepID=UPI000C0A9E22|nr:MULTISPECIES: chemotaxis protein CheW [unclassified Thalassolituus]MAK91410.1 chemotaxis protein CheW [Thalassolituus sp.]MAS26193.1 chemotaxis protein CheW [Oceanospirillaceae bacterium]MAY01085.1 chemotaxis protein CheW [Oceanospirillaceae bacterium]MBL33305.1 chemotaxis protein CheW [Oceanospirillaceae bacterium]MBS54383.1 chemotaxis protein CheW [Oceanospirillaceae bacterium]|tara:strand:- start:345 stop:818 length:474 start_codon:yes stop_codon:yes gene_type:complete